MCHKAYIKDHVTLPQHSIYLDFLDNHLLKSMLLITVKASTQIQDPYLLERLGLCSHNAFTKTGQQQFAWFLNTLLDSQQFNIDVRATLHFPSALFTAYHFREPQKDVTIFSGFSYLYHQDNEVKNTSSIFTRDLIFGTVHTYSKQMISANLPFWKNLIM